jgi:predicted metal-dependent hydrolase
MVGQISSARPNDQFQRGIGQFNARRFFDAHETWEQIWLQSKEPEKTHLQGIIQIAAAFHHYQRGNTAGAISLLQAGVRRLETCAAEFRGLALDDLRSAAREWAELLRDDKDPGAERLPQIRAAGKE